ncbi:hypothetical protein MBCUR_02800 [Methanobrevibacter curvatus]|uniref:Uncharacterized protein n=1 Tax=Methanobrevibacter curvatus TaxID=49547 RepID=A0A166D7D6_9EURY|nr:hypothetical protein MBCUR_02800 [Methanobrevibacter curvatus]
MGHPLIFQHQIFGTIICRLYTTKLQKLVKKIKFLTILIDSDKYSMFKAFQKNQNPTHFLTLSKNVKLIGNEILTLKN